MNGTCKLAANAYFVNTLKTHAPLTAIVTGGIFAMRAPKGTKMPYIVVGDPTEQGDDRLATQGRELTYAIHIFSDYEGLRELGQIENLVQRLLLRQPFTQDGWHARDVVLEQSYSFNEGDDVSHTIVRLRLWMQPLN